MKTLGILTLGAALLVVAAVGPADAQSKTYLDVSRNTIMLGRSGTAPDVGADIQITTKGVGIARVASFGAVSGAILLPGEVAGQTVTVINKGTGTITFAAAATSNVADGTGTTIPRDTAVKFVWDDASSLWFAAK